jgi:hypothetical protein
VRGRTLVDVSFPDLALVLSCLGWAGAAGTVAAYALVSTRRLAADSRAFQGTNAVGAAFLAASAAAAHSWPSTAVNVLWALIGLQAFVAACTWGRREPVAPACDCAARSELTLGA